ncbi:polyketide synthase dehydratase domain-containing protein, partial [Staphylococcus pseudintermedius]
PSAGAGALHALIDANVSTLDEQVFAKTLGADEFFLRDHRLGEHCILPGVAALEMAIQAARLAAPAQRAVAVREVHWLKPVAVGAAPVAVRLGLTPESGALGFELYSLDGGAAVERIQLETERAGLRRQSEADRDRRRADRHRLEPVHLAHRDRALRRRGQARGLDRHFQRGDAGQDAVLAEPVVAQEEFVRTQGLGEDLFVQGRHVSVDQRMQRAGTGAG